MQCYCIDMRATVDLAMADVKPRVPYRQLQAQETRRRITAAARRMFAEGGYAGTSIESIAAEVGIAPRTIYAAFGTKKAILGAICEAWLEESRTILLVREAMDEPDPVQALALIAQAARRQWDMGRDIVRMLNAAAATDGEIAAMLKEWAGEREKGMGAVVRRISDRLQPGVDPRTASALVRALTGPEMFTSLVDASGWKPDRYQQWLAETLSSQLLGV
ncbi:MAG: hypothetical protein QOK05_586 [Chloroflexota bacterium]|jgi:AcrR family transcriptional regulator|nr:hypothetical protein [Chloroflexota bacterium]